MSKFVRINAKDNVLVALEPIAAGTVLDAAGAATGEAGGGNACGNAAGSGEASGGAATCAVSGAVRGGGAAGEVLDAATDGAVTPPFAVPGGAVPGGAELPPCAVPGGAGARNGGNGGNGGSGGNGNSGVTKAPLRAAQDVPMGHKIALRPIAAGENVVKYGYPIGAATRAIAPGEWVHTHNVATRLSGTLEYAYAPAFSPPPPRPAATFGGYLRSDGRAGVRNEIWILPMVGCANEVCRRLAAQYAPRAAEMGLDGIFAFTHPYGCSQMGEDHANTRKILAALAKHPNAGGVLAVGLGCEHNTMDGFRAELGSWDAERARFIVCQDEADELAAGGRMVEELIGRAAMDRRQPLPASLLVVGMKCGGSDGLSGITANAACGAFSDGLVAMGGSTILTEVPEMFGAETILMERCADEAVFRKAVRMVNGFKDYYLRHGQVVYENPSPGNKDGGITTLEDKSLGCVQKGGTAPVADVLEYGEAVSRRGLNLLDGPGNDLVSATAQAAAGAQIIVFTTGRGTPFGAPAVTLKVSTNTALAEKKPNWIDFDAGTIARGESVRSAGERLLEHVLRVAGGQARSR
ncbi:MAG: altronate dehydratase family protein, partial [Clostridiales bacterium]|nr:altronate dehydratase family protein [Clostridiales bacterium]